MVWHPLQRQQLPRGGQLLLGYIRALDQPLNEARWDLMERKSTLSDTERLIRTLTTGKTFTQGEQIRKYGVFELRMVCWQMETRSLLTTYVFKPVCSAHNAPTLAVLFVVFYIDVALI